jgi:hypothetical protein
MARGNHDASIPLTDGYRVANAGPSDINPV